MRSPVPVVYDKAKWHYQGDFPPELTQDQAYVHTGKFLAWVIDRALFSEEFAADCAEAIEAFRSMATTGPQIYRSCDGVLAEDMLSEHGNAFARVYFHFESGAFLEDYGELLVEDQPTMYHVADTWENYLKLRERIDARYDAWKQAAAKLLGS